MKHSKFRTVSNKPKVSVNAKLPKSAFHYILGYVEGELLHYRVSDSNLPILEKDWDEYQKSLETVKKQIHQNYVPSISIVDSENKTVRLVGSGELLISTATLRCWIECLLKMAEKYEAERTKSHFYNEREYNYYRFAALKLLDIISFVKESPSSVVTTKGYTKGSSQRDRYRYYSRTDPHHHNKRKHPFISKRYEKTTFHSRAEGMYAGKFSDEFLREWNSNLDFIYTAKGALPLEVLNSEVYLSHQEISL